MESFHLGHDPEHLSIITLPHPADASNYDEIDNLGITFEDMQHTIAQNLKSIVSLSINEERLKYQLLQSIHIFSTISLEPSEPARHLANWILQIRC